MELEDIFAIQSERSYSQFETSKVVYTLDYDSILYETLFRNGVDPSFIITNYTTMPNVIGIAVLSHFTKVLGIDIFHFNLLLMILTGWLIVRIASHLRVGSTLALACIYFNPVSIFYCQSATKEIPLVFSCTLFVYLFLHYRGALLLLAMAPVICGVAFLRLQTGLILGAILILGLLPYRKTSKCLILGAVALFALFPLTSLTGFWVGADYYRETSGRVGLGEYIDLGLKYIPFAGFVCIPLRAIHNAIDPFPFAPLLADGKSIWSVFACFSQIAFYFTSFVFISLIPLVWRYLTRQLKPTREQHILVLFVLLGWLSVAVVPYVQGRYLYPFLPVASFALAVSARSVPQGIRHAAWLGWAGIAGLQTCIALAALPW